MSRCRVFKAYCAWHVYEYERKRYETFITWAEAMEYADRMARTERPEDYRRTTNPDALAKALSELGYKLKTAIHPHVH